VSCVRISGINTAPYDSGSYISLDTEDPEVLQAVLAVHQAIVDSKEEIEAFQESYTWLSWTDTESFRVDYTLRSGKVLSRVYDEIPVYQEDLDDPDSLTAKLDALVNLAQVRQEGYRLDEFTDDQLVGVTLSGYRAQEGGVDYCVSISRDAEEKLLQAVRADLADGSLGRRYLMDDQARLDNCFVNDLEFIFLVPDERVGEDMPVDAGNSYYVSVTLQTTAKRTLAVLEEAGVLEEPMQLMTHTQWEQAYNDLMEDDGSWRDGDLADYAWATIG
jgi:ABC-2 type transport system permease protein